MRQHKQVFTLRILERVEMHDFILLCWFKQVTSIIFWAFVNKCWKGNITCSMYTLIMYSAVNRSVEAHRTAEYGVDLSSHDW